jgi:hypothetical protein
MRELLAELQRSPRDFATNIQLYMGTFGLPLEQVQEVVSKAWPHFVENIK